MKLKSIATYARQAYANRYAFDRVTIDKAGKMLGHWADTRQTFDPVKLGNIGDCVTRQTLTGVRFYNGAHLVYTFALPA